MQPNQPLQPPQAVYRQPGAGGGFTRKQKIVMLSAGAFVALMLLMMLLAAIFGGGGRNQAELYEVEARNAEVLKLIKTYRSQLRSQQINLFAAQTGILVASDNAGVSAYNKRAFGKAAPVKKMSSQLGFGQLEASLEESASSGHLDEDLQKAISNQLSANRELLTTVNGTTGRADLKAITETALGNIESLLE